MMQFSRSLLAVPFLAGAMMTFVGCSGGEATPTPDTPTPTPTATPVPPLSDYFRVTKMEVGASSEGVDLNGDGEVDNGIEDALDEISSTIVSAVETALDTAEVPQTQQAPILAAVDQIVSSIFTVDAISESLNAPIAAGDLNYVMHFQETSSGVELMWYTADFKETGFGLKDDLGTQSGDLDGSGKGLFGPGDITLTLSFASPNGETSTDVDLLLEAGYTSVSGYSSSLLNNAVSGGAISIGFLLDLVETALEAVNEALGQLPDNPNNPDGGVVIPTDEIVTALNESLTEQADLDLNNDGTFDSFSIGLILNANTVTIVD
ncbi:MAG: hypothetical protein ACKO6N_22495 [Myxococcota bacterium]